VLALEGPGFYQETFELFQDKKCAHVFCQRRMGIMDSHLIVSF